MQPCPVYGLVPSCTSSLSSLCETFHDITVTTGGCVKHCTKRTETYTHRRIPEPGAPLERLQEARLGEETYTNMRIPEPGAPLERLQEARLGAPGFGRRCTESRFSFSDALLVFQIAGVK